MEITLNKYIDRVGLEFEGYWDQDVLNNLCSRMGSESATININKRNGFLANGKESMELKIPFSNNVGDGSLRSSIHRDLTTYIGRELITFPLDQKRLNECMVLMRLLWDEGAYLIDERVGLHVHVSLKNDDHYGVVTSEGFYDSFSEMFESKFKTVAKSRKANRYCRRNLRGGDVYEGLPKKRVMEEHFKRSSSSKYYYINYQIDSFKTLEFRAYGGKDATIEGLCKFIQETVDLIAQYIENTDLKIESKVMADPKKKDRELKFDHKRKFPKRTVIDLNQLRDGDFYYEPTSTGFSRGINSPRYVMPNMDVHGMTWNVTPNGAGEPIQPMIQETREDERRRRMETLANASDDIVRYASMQISPTPNEVNRSLEDYRRQRAGRMARLSSTLDESQTLETDSNGDLRISSRGREVDVPHPPLTDDIPW